ncbi:cupin domain-containing protein [Anaeromyxobacter oryzisoli]|jgi:uncharacterized cupin superfamily protein|uniref:cupin domain-containing protein n=1 Tax=Anaeromyxobacter oryzisoli TaxID=2925408 RepID=UPI001F591898|nr:cupin domain-containing protein [Anaeromyxobacter sp. SG63]
MSEERIRRPRDLVVRAAEREQLVEESLRHPLDPDAEMHAYALGRHVGLARTGVNLIRVPPGRSSYPLHSHAAEEEWLFVLHGAGTVGVGSDRFEIAAGDFVGFPAGSYAHNVHNSGDEDLVYLCGGEIAPVDVIDFPRAGRRATRVCREFTVFHTSAGEPLFPAPR